MSGDRRILIICHLADQRPASEGYRFGPDGLSVAKKTVENFVARAIRLYEQEPGEACASSRFGLYVRRWVRWAGSAL